MTKEQFEAILTTELEARKQAKLARQAWPHDELFAKNLTDELALSDEIAKDWQTVEQQNDFANEVLKGL